MKRRRERIGIDKVVLSYIIGRPISDIEGYEIEVDASEVDKFLLIETTQGTYDEYDGGIDYTSIIQRVKDSKFFKVEYQEWDIDWEKSGGKYEHFPNELVEVFPEQQTITIYK